jgi:hypothetical protein
MSHAFASAVALALLAAAAAGQETSLDAGDARALRRESYPAPRRVDARAPVPAGLTTTAFLS